MLKKKKKIYPNLTPLEQYFFPLGHQMERKTSFGGPREKKEVPLRA